MNQIKRLKLNQIIAIVAGKKTKAENFLTAAHHGLKADSIVGLSRTYQPIDDEGERFPPENRDVQIRVFEALRVVGTELTSYYDAVATQEYGNRTASADVCVGDKVVLRGQPVTVLLFLEKRLQDLRTFISKLPALAKDQTWEWDNNRNCFASQPVETHKTAKIPTPVVLYEATKEHPAQVEMNHKDVMVGNWTKIDFSGAIPAQQQAEMLERCEALLEGVKVAREEANSQEVEQRVVGKQVMDFVFGELRAPQATA